MRIVNEVKSEIDSGNYNDSDELVKFCLEGLGMYKTLKKMEKIIVVCLCIFILIP